MCVAKVSMCIRHMPALCCHKDHTAQGCGMHMHTIGQHMPSGHAGLPDCKCKRSMLSQGQLNCNNKVEEASAKAL